MIKSTRKDIQKTLEMVSSFEGKFKEISLKHSKSEILSKSTLAADLADIQEAAFAISDLVDRLDELLLTHKNMAGKALIDLTIQLDHIQYHYKEGKRDMETLADLLYEKAKSDKS